MNSHSNLGIDSELKRNGVFEKVMPDMERGMIPLLFRSESANIIMLANTQL